MTILWIYDMPLIPEAGGTERITSLIAKGLTQLGHNCMGIMVFNREKGSITYNGIAISDLYAFLMEHKVDFIINQIAYDTWLLSSFLHKGGKRWQKEGGRIISCLHFDPRPTSDLYMYRVKQNKNCRDYINLIKSFILYPYYIQKNNRRRGATFNDIYDRSDAFVLLSASHIPYFKKVTRREEYAKLHIINNPLTFEDISNTSAIKFKEKIIMVCSRMDEYQKRISVALKVWQKIQLQIVRDGWHLIIVGDGPDLVNYKNYAEKHKLLNISFEGRQNPEPYYKRADILLMTSIGEGWGLTLTESLQRGVVPIVMNTCPVYQDIINSGYNGYLTKDNVNDFASKILLLTSDRCKLRSMQCHAINSADRFSLENTIKKWTLLINKINHGN